MKKLRTKATIIHTSYIVGADITKCVIKFKNPYTNCINKVTGTTKRNPDDENNDVLATRICESRAKMQMFQRLERSVMKLIDKLYNIKIDTYYRVEREKEHINELLNTDNDD